MKRAFPFLMFILIILTMVYTLPVSAQLTNPSVTVGCSGISVSGIAGVTGAITVNVTRVSDGAALVTNATANVTSGQNILFVVPFAPQASGTQLTAVVVLGTFNSTSTVGCVDAPIGDGRLNAVDIAAPIAVYCASNGGVNILNIDRSGRGGEGASATGIQVANGLALAAATRQNQQIVAGIGGTSLWALSSGELQAVHRGLVNYDFIFSPSVCGIVASVSTTVIVTATPIGTQVAPVYVYYPPVTVNTTPIASSGSCVAPAGARGVHIVQPGENLFRIGLRYGVDFRILAAYNGITNPALIYVGQCIIIP